MIQVHAYECNLYWKCPSCNYENNSMWFYDGNSSYIFKCERCNIHVQVIPPQLIIKSNN